MTRNKMTLEERGRIEGKARAEKSDKEELSKQAKRTFDKEEQENRGFQSEIGNKGKSSRGNNQK